MSAYIVTDETILQIVGFANAYSLRFEHNGRTYRAAEHDTCQALVDALIGENYASVNYRYRESDTPHHIDWTGACNSAPDPLEVAKLVGEYDYQACEHPTYRDSLAASVVASMKAAAKLMEPGARAIKEAAKAAARDAERARLLNDFSHLEACGADGYAGEKLGAKNIRAELRQAFPGVKFSVRIGRGSMVSSIDIRWTDGPTEAEVDSIVSKYKLGRFDSMTDGYDYSDAQFPRIFGGARYVSTARDISEAVEAEALELVREAYGVADDVTLDTFRRAGGWSIQSERGPDDVRTMVNKLLTSYNGITGAWDGDRFGADTLEIIEAARALADAGEVITLDDSTLPAGFWDDEAAITHPWGANPAPRLTSTPRLT